MGNERRSIMECGLSWRLGQSNIGHMCNGYLLVDIRICVLCVAQVIAMIQQGAKPNAVDPKVSEFDVSNMCVHVCPCACRCVWVWVSVGVGVHGGRGVCGCACGSLRMCVKCECV